MSEHDELAERVAKLEQELAEAKKALEALRPEKPFVPRAPLRKIDYTEGMTASGPALKAMVDLINPQGLKFDKDAWARNRYSEPSGFGPGPGGKWEKGAAKVRPEEKLEVPQPPRSLWSK